MYSIILGVLLLIGTSFSFTIDEFYYKTGEAKYILNIDEKLTVKIKPDFLIIRIIPIPEDSPVEADRINKHTFKIKKEKYFKRYTIPVILENERYDKIFTVYIELNNVKDSNENVELNIDDSHLGGDIIIDKSYPRTLIFDNGCQGKIGNRKVCRDMFGNYIIK